MSSAGLDKHDPAGMARWLRERRDAAKSFLELDSETQIRQFLEPWQRNVLPHLAFRFEQAAQLIEIQEKEIASWKAVSHDHSERLKKLDQRLTACSEMLLRHACYCGSKSRDVNMHGEQCPYRRAFDVRPSQGDTYKPECAPAKVTSAQTGQSSPAAQSSDTR